MGRLLPQDFRALLEFLRELYALRDLEAFRAHFLSALPRIVPSEVTTYDEMNPTKKESKDWSNPPEAFTPTLKHAWAQVLHEHSILMHHTRNPDDSRVLKLSDFLTQSQLHHLALYNELYRKWGVESNMGIVLSMSLPLVIGVGFHRGKPDFSERERSMLNLLRPHLVQAYHNAEAASRMQQELELARQGTEGMGRGMIVLSPEGRVRRMSTRARQWVEEYFGSPSGLTDSLPEALQRWVRHQQTLLVGADEIPLPRGPLVVEREGKRLVVRLVSDRDHSLLLLEERHTALQPESLKPLRLTRREAEVLPWVAQGRSNYAIGKILGMSELTVKKHLEHIYAKLGVWNRTEAAARALAAVTSSPPL
jgi:DNA-binding CsgD family transcriptional regulator